MSRPTVLRKHLNGLIAVVQEAINGWDISYNPDDGRFYVHYPDENHTVLATYKELRNARQRARAQPPEVAK